MRSFRRAVGFGRFANSGDGGFDGLGMPDRTLVGPIHFKRRSEGGVTPLFQFVDQQLPTFGPLPASVNKTIRGHN